MSSVLPAEGDLRRVIGDGAAIPDGEVDGLSHDDLLELYRNLVLLRTYDERSVIYHRQGRIGTYAIFWNHEAMQAGSVFALEDRDWIFPSTASRPSGCCVGFPRRRSSQLVARASEWLVESGGVQRRVDLRSDRDARPTRRLGYAWGARLKGEDRVAIAYFGDGATSEGAVPRGRNIRGSHAALRPILFCNNNQWAISTPLSEQTAAPTLADKAIGYGMPGVRVDGGDVLAVDQATRDAVVCPPAGDGPTFIEAVSYRAAPHATADDPSIYIDPERVEEEKTERVRRALRALPPTDSESSPKKMRRWSGPRLSSSCAPVLPLRKQRLRRTRLWSSSTPTPTHPRSQAHDLAELRRLLGG